MPLPLVLRPRRQLQRAEHEKCPEVAGDDRAQQREGDHHQQVQVAADKAATMLNRCVDHGPYPLGVKTKGKTDNLLMT